MQKWLIIWALCAVGFGCAQTPTVNDAPASFAVASDVPSQSRPIDQHGAIKVVDGRIVNAQGAAFSVAGPSLFWSTIGWNMDRFYSADTVKTFAEDWQAGLVRAAISGHNEGGYLDHPDAQMRLAETIIDAAIDAGIYVIVDWHSHRAEDNVAQSKQFFTTLARKYGNYPNLIWEIYNEPLGTTDWSTQVKPYAEDVIAAIRDIDPDNLILVGTQTWSQDLDKAVADPIKGFDNIGYTLHFYTASHKDELRARAQKAIDGGLPVFVSEWGAVRYDGDGAVDYASTQKWLDFMQDNGLSHAIWSLSDKKEGAAFLKPGQSSTGEWSQANLTEMGRYARKIIREWSDTAKE